MNPESLAICLVLRLMVTGELDDTFNQFMKTNSINTKTAKNQMVMVLCGIKRILIGLFK